jgi:hypothetical protein
VKIKNNRVGNNKMMKVTTVTSCHRYKNHNMNVNYYKKNNKIHNQHKLDIISNSILLKLCGDLNKYNLLIYLNFEYIFYLFLII